jgi:hypothetical protein
MTGEVSGRGRPADLGLAQTGHVHAGLPDSLALSRYTNQ